MDTQSIKYQDKNRINQLDEGGTTYAQNITNEGHKEKQRETRPGR